MGQITLKCSQQTIEAMKSQYRPYFKSTPPHAVFQAKTPTAVITAYQSGKVLFQGETSEEEAKKWKTKADLATKEKVTPKSNNQPEFLHLNHIGSDESGTGDFFGPITTCATYIHEDQIVQLKDIGIQDSKKLTDSRINKLSQSIIDMDIPYSLMILNNEKYNDLQSKGWSQGKMKTMLHNACINNVLNKIGNQSYKGILIDQFCMPHVYKRHLASEGKKLPAHTYFMTKAENYSIAVAAASIIARASFVKEMNRLSDHAGLSLSKGASAKVDHEAAQLLRQYGRDILYKTAKLHFANTKKAERLI